MEAIITLTLAIIGTIALTLATKMVFIGMIITSIALPIVWIAYQIVDGIKNGF